MDIPPTIESMTTGNEIMNLLKVVIAQETKHVLLQAVRQHDAHRASYGKIDETLKKVRDKVIQHLPKSSWHRCHKPTLRIREKLQRIMGKQRMANRRDKNTSKIEKVVGLSEKFLDDFIAE